MDANGLWYGLMDQEKLQKQSKQEPAFRAIIIGAGQRGRCYAKALQKTNGIVAAVADPVAQRRSFMVTNYICKGDTPKPEQEFETWQDFVSYERARRRRQEQGDAVEPGVDTAFICVQDSDHAETIVALAPLGLHLFCEKPLAPTLEDCLKIYASLTQTERSSPPSRVFGIGHVLRYSPHNRQLRKMVLEDHCIGDVLSIEHTEPVGYWHFSHSYVRGNWRKESTSAPSLLAKSCHDIDFLLWLLCSPANPASAEAPHQPSLISSVGHLGFFKKSQKPKKAGAATNCLSCPIESSCIYSAKRIYTEQAFHPGKVDNWPWPISVISPDVEDLYLNKGPEVAKDLLLDILGQDYTSGQLSDHEVSQKNWFGRCVWEADNDVCDDQTVTMQWDESRPGEEPRRRAKTATFHMISHTRDQCVRRGRIYGSKGEISYDGSTITVHDFDTGETRHVEIERRGGGHGDGDDGLTEQFAAAVEACQTGRMSAYDAQRTYIGCTLEDAVRSHAVVFAAEAARRNRRIIDWPAWWKQEVEAKLMERTGWEVLP